MDKEYKILIVPSSDTESLFENVGDFETAVKVSDREETGCVHEFDTKIELDAFIEGYRAAIGYLGDGVFFTNVNG